LVASRKARYEPIDDILDRQTAIFQASSIVDIMMQMAVETRDVERMAWCMSAWLEISDRLIDAEDEEIIEEEKSMIGFQPNGREIPLNGSGD
jgi:hypothetical protein